MTVERRIDSDSNETLTARLVVSDPDAAADFYVKGLGAEIGSRFTLPDGTVTNIEITVGTAQFSLTSEGEEWGLVGPNSLGGSPVLFRLTVPDAMATSDRMTAAGAVEVIPVEDRPYGRCEGRVRDPFGHLWILSHVSEDLTEDEIRRRLESAYGNRS